MIDMFNICGMTQTFIFVNTKSFAYTLCKIMKNNGCKVSLIFGDMGAEERDEFVGKFRRQEINVIITTNLLSRGIDVPQAELVVNFDIPC